MCMLVVHENKFATGWIAYFVVAIGIQLLSQIKLALFVCVSRL